MTHRTPDSGQPPPGDRICVVVPVFDEAHNLDAFRAAIAPHDRGYRWCFVDDGSTDGTGAVLRAWAASDPARIGVRHHAENRGYGASLITGFAYAIASGADAVVTMDCDGQHDPSLLPVFASRILAAGAPDIVSGTRYFGADPASPHGHAVGGVRVPPDRLRINREFTARINAITGWALTDTFCGFKGYRTEALRRLTLDIPGYGFPIQFWMRAHAAGLTVDEQPIPLIYTAEDRDFNRQFSGADERRAYYLQILEEECRLAGVPCAERTE